MYRGQIHPRCTLDTFRIHPIAARSIRGIREIRGTRDVGGTKDTENRMSSIHRGSLSSVYYINTMYDI